MNTQFVTDPGPVPIPSRVGPQALVLLAVDMMAELESLFGEELGETLMRNLQDRLALVLPGLAQIWRPEPRRLAVSLPGARADSALALAQYLQAEAARRPFALAEGPIAITLAAGVAAGEAEEATGLGPAARRALSAALAAGVGAIRLGGPTDGTAPQSTAAQAAMRALAADGLTLACQPVVRAEHPGTVAFHECLARLQAPGEAKASAQSFMPQLERLGMAPHIDRQVLTLALAMLAEQPRARLSINVSPLTMQDGEWMRLFDAAIERRPESAERLIVEVTETAAMLDAERTRRFIDRLRRAGAALALDDFGAGHTSLISLRDFRFDMIKLDASFARGITTDADNRFLVARMVEIARHFEMMTVAEGVEHAGEPRVLADLGVDCLQGYLFGQPAALPSLGQQMAERQRRFA